jgi:hypothetical protein
VFVVVRNGDDDDDDDDDVNNNGGCFDLNVLLCVFSRRAHVVQFGT